MQIRIKYDYPINVYMCVFGFQDYDGDCNEAWMLAAINTLTDREKNVIEHRYKLKESQEKTGEHFGVGRNRIGQIEQKALRKLRHPSRNRDMKISRIVAERDRLREDLNNATKTIAEQQFKIDEILRKYPLETRKVIAENENLNTSKLSIKIEELDLSVRSFNCLKRAGYNTVNNILSIRAYDDFCKIRNLGKKSADEIITKMRELGFDEWAESLQKG